MKLSTLGNLGSSFFAFRASLIAESKFWWLKYDSAMSSALTAASWFFLFLDIVEAMVWCGLWRTRIGTGKGLFFYVWRNLIYILLQYYHSLLETYGTFKNYKTSTKLEQIRIPIPINTGRG